MTPDEIIDDLNRKFFVAHVRDGGFSVYTRVCWQAEVQNVPGQLILCCETFTAFRKRFPKKQLIEGKLRNVGDFWLRHPRRQPCDHEQVIQRVYLAKGE
jgi:hypothetical protein